MTPKEYRALVDRFTYEQDRLDMRAGTLASVMASAWGGKKDNGDPYNATDFFPSLKRLTLTGTSKTTQSSRVQSTEEQITALQAWTVVFQQHKRIGNLVEDRTPMRLPGVSEILPEPAPASEGVE